MANQIGTLRFFCLIINDLRNALFWPPTLSAVFPQCFNLSFGLIRVVINHKVIALETKQKASGFYLAFSHAAELLPHAILPAFAVDYYASVFLSAAPSQEAEPSGSLGRF